MGRWEQAQTNTWSWTHSLVEWIWKELGKEGEHDRKDNVWNSQRNNKNTIFKSFSVETGTLKPKLSPKLEN